MTASTGKFYSDFVIQNISPYTSSMIVIHCCTYRNNAGCIICCAKFPLFSLQAVWGCWACVEGVGSEVTQRLPVLCWHRRHTETSLWILSKGWLAGGMCATLHPQAGLCCRCNVSVIAASFIAALSMQFVKMWSQWGYCVIVHARFLDNDGSGRA